MRVVSTGLTRLEGTEKHQMLEKGSCRNLWNSGTPEVKPPKDGNCEKLMEYKILDKIYALWRPGLISEEKGVIETN